MSTHPAVVVRAFKAPLEIEQVTTPLPTGNEVQFRVEWVPSAPLDVYQSEVGLMTVLPQCLGDTAAGIVTSVGPDVERLIVGDKVFGFFFHGSKEKAQQLYVTASEHLLAKVPENLSLAAAATIPNNFVTAFYTLSEVLSVDLPWPDIKAVQPGKLHEPMLIWGGSSSVGQYAIQILRHWGYTNIFATSSPAHHETLRELGAKTVVDYRDASVVETLRNALGSVSGQEPRIRVFDCINSKEGSALPISKITAKFSGDVAALLPVVITPAWDSTGAGLQLAGDLREEAEWSPQISVHNVAAYGYESNDFLKRHLQPEIMPTLFATGAVKANKAREITGSSLLERAQKSLDILKSGSVSGERLVFRVFVEQEAQSL